MKSRSIAFLGCLLPAAFLPACGANAEQPAGVGGAPVTGTGGVAGTGAFTGSGSVTAASGGVTGSGSAVGSGATVGAGATAGAGGLSAGTGAVPGAGGVVVGAGGVSVVGAGGAATGTGGVPSVAGTEYTFKTGTYSVLPGQEVYKCQDFTNPFGKDIGIVQMVTDLTKGSHHMFAFVLPNGQLSLKDNLVDCPGGGVEFHDYLTTSGSPEQVTTYKPGVGRVFAGGNGLRLNVHLINAGTDARDAFVTFKVTYNDPSTLQQRAASIFLNQVLLSVPPGMSTQSRTYSLNQEIWLMGDASHMHKRGIRFQASTDKGDMLYDGTDWQEPKPKSFDPPLHLMPGTKITWACTYNNDTGQTLSFGESAANNEMCIFPGEFYNPAGQQISYQSFF